MIEALINTGVFHQDRNAFVLGKEPMIFHCNHYNVFLQMAIEETKEYIDVYPILVDSGHEVVYSQFRELFKEAGYSVEDRKKMVETCFQKGGFGQINLNDINENGGEVATPNEHYAISWVNKFGQRKEGESGVCFFTRGFLAGATEAVYDLEFGSTQATQTKCLTKGDSICQFEISKRDEVAELFDSPQEGVIQSFDEYIIHENVDYAGIREALTNMPIEGSPEDGLIDAFGVLLTRHYANYYNLISLRTMLTMEHDFEEAGVSIVKELLTEAGHVCAFNTLGGIALSAEWNALIKPSLQTQDDWTHGIVACANSVGWGKWEIMELNPEGETRFKITGSYESNSFLKLHEERTNFPICCFLDGALAGVMNLVYHGDIRQTPTLDEDYYNGVFKAKGRFVSKQVKARTMGDEFDEFVVTRS